MKTTETKVCAKCEVEKPATKEFFRVRNDKCESPCRTCRSAYNKAYRANWTEEQKQMHSQNNIRYSKTKKGRVSQKRNAEARKKSEKYNGSEKYRSRARKYNYKFNKQNRVDIKKAYVASMIGISVKDLPDELYEFHKALLLVKRQLSKKFDIHMSSFNIRTVESFRH